MTYVFLDTCVIVDCAYTRHEKANPTLLDKVIECCEGPTAKLLLSEVVLLELDRVSKARAEEVDEGLREVERTVESIAKKKTIGIDSRKALIGLIKQSKEQIISSAEESFAKVRELSQDSDRAFLIPMVADDLVAAVGMALRGANPSKRKEVVGLLQGDCLIVAGLERFRQDHPDDQIVICSSNTKDFAMKDEQGWHLYPEIAGRVPGAEFYCNPVEVLKAIRPAISEAESAELEELNESYDSVAKDRGSVDYFGMLEVLTEASEAMRKTNEERNRALRGAASAIERHQDLGVNYSLKSHPSFMDTVNALLEYQNSESVQVAKENAEYLGNLVRRLASFISTQNSESKSEGLAPEDE